MFAIISRTALEPSEPKRGGEEVPKLRSLLSENLEVGIHGAPVSNHLWACGIEVDLVALLQAGGAPERRELLRPTIGG